jgi:protease IV
MRHQPIEPMNPTSDPTPEGLAAAPISAAVPATAASEPQEGLQTVAAQLVRELVRERRTERRWRIFFRLAWFGLVVAIAWGVIVSRGTGGTGSVSGPHTALVEVRGEIAADAEANAEDIVSALRSAFEDDGAQAVVLRINSPGGSPVQAGIVYDEIKRLKELHKKRVYAVVEDVCASGAYYIAVGADEIFVDKASVVGSIGVLMDGFGFTGLMDKLGVERRLITAGANKGMLDPFSPQNEAQKAMAQAMIDQVHQQFIQVVKEGRGNRLKEQPDTFSGLFWNGEESIKLGLADKFGNLDFVAREVVKAEEVVNYTPQENVAERLAKRFGAAIGAGAVRALAELPALR